MSFRSEMLVDPAWLEARLDDPSVRILECTTHLEPQPVGPSKVISGRPEFEREHIPGARYVSMFSDLSDPRGRYPYTMPGTAQVEAKLTGLGVGNDDHVVLYARGGVMSATRVWYVLHVMGHQRLSLLDGGFERWQAEGRPVETGAGGALAGPAGGDRAPYRARPVGGRIADLDTVRASLGSPDTRLVNSLSREQFTGSGGAHYGRPGRIPASVSVPARELVSEETGRFLPEAALRERFDAVGALDAPKVITYCGGGIAATVDAFVLEMLGHPDWAVYDNSLLEWSTIPELPMEVG